MKLIPLRTAVILGTATATGSAAGESATALAHATGHPVPHLGHVVTGMAALWIAEKLDALIADEAGGTR
ncbi:hypothetical protein [Yinghuangia seranimata]|uniref:hypothetical protein n=1 Tax=Yinghuangia seranimata TaxID=408067 RepID=UPI00248AF05A|nr:hypothetical protein [Yinghuangia seranimata]MDI2130061.1 hypothetical protein [Yinghuangia seranimata]